MFIDYCFLIFSLSLSLSLYLGLLSLSQLYIPWRKSWCIYFSLFCFCSWSSFVTTIQFYSWNTKFIWCSDRCGFFLCCIHFISFLFLFQSISCFFSRPLTWVAVVVREVILTLDLLNLLHTFLEKFSETFFLFFPYDICWSSPSSLSFSFLFFLHF